jgi:hypothetical protein
MLNAAQQILQTYAPSGRISLGGFVWVWRAPVQFTPGTPVRKHRITDRRQRKLAARWQAACLRHQLAAGVPYNKIKYV